MHHFAFSNIMPNGQSCQIEHQKYRMLYLPSNGLYQSLLKLKWPLSANGKKKKIQGAQLHLNFRQTMTDFLVSVCPMQYLRHTKKIASSSLLIISNIVQIVLVCTMCPELFPDAVSLPYTLQNHWEVTDPEQLHERVQFTRTKSGRAWACVQWLLDSKVCALYRKKSQLTRWSVSSQVKAMDSSCSECFGERSPLGRRRHLFVCSRNKFVGHLPSTALGVGDVTGQKTKIPVLLDFLPF